MAEISDAELDKSFVAYYTKLYSEVDGMKLRPERQHREAMRAAIEAFLSGSSEYQRGYMAGFVDARDAAVEECDERMDDDPAAFQWNHALEFAGEAIRALQPGEK